MTSLPIAAGRLLPAARPVVVRRRIQPRPAIELSRLTRYHGGTYSHTVDRIASTDGTFARTDLIRLNPGVEAYSLGLHRRRAAAAVALRRGVLCRPAECAGPLVRGGDRLDPAELLPDVARRGTEPTTARRRIPAGRRAHRRARGHRRHPGGDLAPPTGWRWTPARATGPTASCTTSAA